MYPLHCNASNRNLYYIFFILILLKITIILILLFLFLLSYYILFWFYFNYNFFFKPALWSILWPLFLHRDEKINKFFTCFPKNPPIVHELLKFFIENYVLSPHLGDLGRFRVGTFWGLGRFEAWDVLRLGRFVAWDVLELARFVLGRSVVGRVVLGRFVGAP
jgi:hypothetical protein